MYWCLWLIHIGGAIDCNEWETEKRHECTNLVKSKTTRIMMATVRHVTSSSGLREFLAAWLLGFC